MKLQDKLPKGISVGGRFYRCDFDFRNVLKMMDVMARDDLIDDARDYLALKCIMRRVDKKRVPELLSAARKLLFPETKKQPEQARITDFVQDADLIRAAFWQEYGVNLYRDKLHWHEFSLLIAGLPEGNRYSEVIGIRARPMPAPTKWNAEERKWLAKAKAELALKMTDKERERSFEDSLRNVALSLLSLAEQGKRGDADG